MSYTVARSTLVPGTASSDLAVRLEPVHQGDSRRDRVVELDEDDQRDADVSVDETEKGRPGVQRLGDQDAIAHRPHRHARMKWLAFQLLLAKQVRALRVLEAGQQHRAENEDVEPVLG